MNRLIIVGNGFDLAHGMKTSYHDFILSYFKKLLRIADRPTGYRDEFIELTRNNFFRALVGVLERRRCCVSRPTTEAWLCLRNAFEESLIDY